LLELDERAAEALRKGGRIRREIPARDPGPLPPPPANWTLGDYRALRQPSAVLIRPLLLESCTPPSLFGYQREGITWLQARRSAILADDMGLGKTVQAVAALAALVRAGRVEMALIVCPRSLIATWEHEFSLWAPELSRLRLTPPASIRDRVWSSMVGRQHVLITNYEHLRTLPKALATHGVDLLIADEAHRIRNAAAQVTASLKNLRRKRVWALTGTPVERDAADLATLLSIVDPRRFAPGDASLPLTTLRARARPFVLRRRKEDVLADLPSVIERTERLDLLPAQRSSYTKALQRINNFRGSVDDTLQVLGELRRICDLDPQTKTGAKLERLVEILETIDGSGEKAVVFSTTLEPLHALDRALPKSLKRVIVTGDVETSERERRVQEFRRSPDVRAFLATTWVAGEGLTLTEANHVLFFNEWWNPSTNIQARDRVVRIGQKRGVQVCRFITRDTIEEVVDRVLKRKSGLVHGLVDRLAETDAPDSAVLNEVMRELRSTSR
jgi:SNF2 family DNA or RNA helicase